MVLLARAALPLGVARLLESQVASTLRARVAIGDVDLGLLRGTVALDDVAVWDASQPAAVEPVIAWKRVAANLGWWRLLAGEIRLQSVDIQGLGVAIDRLATGQINLLALLPEPAPTTPEAVEAPPADDRESGWGIAIDQLRFQEGALRFRDLMVESAEPLEIALPAISVARVAIRPHSYSEPGHLRLALALDRGRLDLAATLRMQEEGPVVDATIRAVRLPLRRTRVYVPNVGLTELRGLAGTTLRLRYAADTGAIVGGSLLVRELAVLAEELSDPALAWRQLTVRLERLALEERTVRIAEVLLDAPTLVVRPRHPEPLPLLAIARSRPPTVDTPADQTTTDEQPWRWSLGQLRAEELRGLVLGTAQRLEVGGRLEVRDLRGPESRAAPISLGLTLGSGTVQLDGMATLEPIGFSGTAAISSLELPALVAVAGAVPDGVVTGGTLGLDLAVEASPQKDGVRARGELALDGLAGSWPTPQDTRATAARLAVTDLALALPPPGTARALEVQGVVTADDLSVASAIPAPLGVAARRLVVKASEIRVPSQSIAEPLRVQGDVAIDELTVTDPEAPAEHRVAVRRVEVNDATATVPAASQNAPLRVGIGAVRLDAPVIAATRTEAGVRLPGVPAAASPEPPSSPEAAPAVPAPEVTVGRFRLGDGRITIIDRAVQPDYRGGLQALGIEIDGLRLPEPAMQRLRLEATSSAGGRLRASGALGTREARLALTIDELALTPFNPYARAASPYSIARGRLSATTDATRRGAAISARTKLILHDFDLTGAEGDSLFQQQFGIPLSVALALLRDLDGDIVLDVPVESDAAGTRVGFGTIVAGALRQALLGALTSPLKLAGSLFGSGSASPAAPASLAFETGRPLLRAEAEEQLDGIGRLLATRPGLVLRLGAAAAPADIRWLAEQQLLKELIKPRGLLGAVGGLAERGTRTRVVAALSARSRGEAAPVESSDAEALERWLADQPPPTPEQLQELGDARIARVRDLLAQRHGIAGQRVVADDPPPTAPAEPSLLARLDTGQ